jgi:hypothetical protein
MNILEYFAVCIVFSVSGIASGIVLFQFQASVREQDGSHNYHRDCHDHQTAQGKRKDNVLLVQQLASCDSPC